MKTILLLAIFTIPLSLSGADTLYFYDRDRNPVEGVEVTLKRGNSQKPEKYRSRKDGSLVLRNIDDITSFTYSKAGYRRKSISGQSLKLVLKGHFAGGQRPGIVLQPTLEQLAAQQEKETDNFRGDVTAGREQAQAVLQGLLGSSSEKKPASKEKD